MAAERANELQILKAKVTAFREEVEKAISFHEAWRPMVNDTGLHERMGRSYATNTFNTIRAALRREVLLGLVRLWDNNKAAVNLENIGNILADKRIVAALVEECMANWADTPYRAHMRSEMAKTLQAQIDEARDLIAKYGDGRPGYAIRNHLTDVRNEWLAHRQVTPSVVPGPERNDDEVEEFYRDMLKLVVTLAHAVHRTAYNPGETVDIRHRDAQFFWNGARGERTEGHPDYKGPPPP